jgi:hypothetical protein
MKAAIKHWVKATRANEGSGELSSLLVAESVEEMKKLCGRSAGMAQMAHGAGRALA